MSHHLDDDETTFRVVTAEQAARRCEHGSVSQHGEIGKDWCPGALNPLAEPWRVQLVDQMNMDTSRVTAFAGGGVQSGRFAVEHPPLTQTLRERFTPPEGTVFDMTRDSLADFKPLGWFSSWGERWYDVPIYNSVVDDLGFDPLFRDIAGSEITMEMRWRATHADLSK